MDDVGPASQHLTRFFLFVLLLASAVAQPAPAQKIHFTDRDNFWSVEQNSSGWPTLGPHGWIGGSDRGHFFQYRLGSDTVVEGKTYTSLEGYFFHYGGVHWIREDTAAGIVFALRDVGREDSRVDTEPLVLYDYNRVVGDTVRTSDPYSGDLSVHVVAAIDSARIRGVSHRVWHFTALDTLSRSYSVIEGIGCTGAPWFPLNPIDDGWYWEVYCFGNGTAIPPVDGTTGGLDNRWSCLRDLDFSLCRTCQTHEPDLNNPYAAFELYPYVKGYLAHVHNPEGRVVKTVPVTDPARLTIPTSGLRAGDYRVRVVDSSRRGKIQFVFRVK